MKLPLHLFERFGVELEYMLVKNESLDVYPITDEILKDVAGAYESEVETGELAWSNELVLHVIELKTNGPMHLDGLSDYFHRDVLRINELAKKRGATLMPTAMHPWMDPHKETVLWPHEYSAVYEAFDRIFGCQGHGWSNLQSTHINLPFCGDEEFGRLHAAIRLVLAVLPALAASSPIYEGKIAAHLDARLNFYRSNAAKMPIVSGRVIPEPAYSRIAYDEMIFHPLYKTIAPHDPEGILQFEFLNARGAIARFDRSAIEIRVVDIQECPAADLAIVNLVVAVLEELVAENWSRYDAQAAASIDMLEPILLSCIKDGDGAMIDDATFLGLFGLEANSKMTARNFWKAMRDRIIESRPALSDALRPLNVICEQGCLSRRILDSVGSNPTHETLAETYRRLSACLLENEMFVG